MALMLLVMAACSSPSRPEQAPSKNGRTTPEPRPSDERTSVVVLFNEQEIWVGNEEHESDPAARYSGALNDLEAAFDRHPPTILPAGSTIAVAAYSTGARQVLAMTPLNASPRVRSGLSATTAAR